MRRNWRNKSMEIPILVPCCVQVANRFKLENCLIFHSPYQWVLQVILKWNSYLHSLDYTDRAWGVEVGVPSCFIFQVAPHHMRTILPEHTCLVLGHLYLSMDLSTSLALLYSSWLFFLSPWTSHHSGLNFLLGKLIYSHGFKYNLYIIYFSFLFFKTDIQA